MTERTGVRHIFGQFRGASNRWSAISQPGTGGGTQGRFDRTFCWGLNTTIDLHGNRIEYEYLPPDGDADSTGTLYPSRIRYSFTGENYQEVRFQYETRPDKFEDYRPGFRTAIGNRLIGIEAHSFYGGVDHLVRSYQLEYAYRVEDGISAQTAALDLGVSTLKRVVQHDRSGNPGNYLPPLLFEYSQMDLSKAILHSILPPDLNIGEAGGNVQIADVDGDSLPDIVKTADSISGEQIVCFNRGEYSSGPGLPKQLHFDEAKVVVPSSSGFRLGDANSTLMDVDGDGLTDFVRIDPGDITGKQLYIFQNNARLDGGGGPGFATTPRISLGAPPAIAFNNPAVRQMDVNFDKESDFISFHPDLIGSFSYYFRNRESGVWTELGPVLANPDMTGYALDFEKDGESNPRVHLADMNGDRLLDLVYLDFNGSGIGATLTIRYWPYAGLGQWGAMHEMTLSGGDGFQVDALDPRDVLVQDVTGDGLADVVVIKSDGGGSSLLELRVNVAGQKWSAPFVRTGLPRHLPRDPLSPTTFRQADLNANGSTDLIWRNQVIGDDSWQWLELLPDGKPNLLTRIDNSLGKRTEITYGNAVDDMIRAREAGFPWQTYSPFSMQVVRRIRTTCGFDLDGTIDAQGQTTDQYVSEFHYRDAYYDGFEREFRGFAFAERIDYGDDFLLDTNLVTMARAPGWDASKTPTGQVSGPTLVTRFRYLTGAADGIDNDEYPPGWAGPVMVDEVTPRGGREEEILKGRQVWEEKVDPWVLHDPNHGAEFDRGCWLALNSTNAIDRTRMTPNAFVYSRARQEWAIRRLYRPNDAALAPPGRFNAATPAVRVLDGVGGSGRSVSFAFVSTVTNEIIEANGLLSAALGYPFRNPILTATTSDYDDYGNQTVQRDFGVIGNNGYDDERFTTTEFALQGEALSRWIIGEPARVRVTDENGVFVRETRNFYDGDPFAGLALGTLGSRALLHRVEEVVTDSAPLPAIGEPTDRPGDPRLLAGTVIQQARSKYDTNGNHIVTIDPLGDPNSPGIGHTRRIGYDETFQTYPVSETIVVGNGNPDLTISANYDPGFGVITNSTDFNGNLTSYEYDSFARLVAIVKPFDSSEFPTALFQYLPADPNRGRVYAYDRAGNLNVKPSDGALVSDRVITRLREVSGEAGMFVTASYTDGCGRKLADVKEGEIPGQWIVSGAESYSRRMSARSSWLPFSIASGSDDSTPPHFGQLWPTGRPPATGLDGLPVVKSDKLTDPLGREIVSINPPETLALLTNEIQRTRSITQLLPLEKRFFDENDTDPASPNYNTPMVQMTDGLGRLIEVREVTRLNDDGTAGAKLAEWPTQYRYDLNDNLTHITDSQGNEKWFRYDGIKRKLFMNDPDRGVMFYSYDEGSNLRETVDAKSQRISYSYDGVNRLLTEHYRPTNQPPDVAYHYDAPSANLPLGDGTIATAGNTKGMLAWVQDLSGEEHTSYDARERVVYVVKRIPDPQFLAPNLPGEDQGTVVLVSYKTGFEYDSLDRVIRLTYPDNDEVGYLYSPRNLLQRITGGPSGSIISNIVYRASDQLSQIDYGNGVRTRYDYDPRLRLNSLLTVTHPDTATNLQLINFAYEFDGVSNIKSISDNRPEAVVPAGDPRRNTQIFAYDDLYRITGAQYSFAPPGRITNNGSIHYRYDRIGNMLAQTSDIQHLERGLSVTDLGAMAYGGSSGKSNRLGRLPSDAPGPHALSRITPLSASGGEGQGEVVRNYPYDSNGNMTVIDGLTNTWDFKDRLVSVENSEMRAIYTYDYTDHRITKRVAWKVGAPDPDNPQSAIRNPQSKAVLYPDKYFEVRDYDAPTKYVWNGNTRVARVTGSLSGNQRVQRFRLWPGWNLVSLAVTATKGLKQLGGTNSASPILGGYRWNSTTSGWETLDSNTTLIAGNVLWVKAATNSEVSVTGSYVDPVNRVASAGASFQSSAGLEIWSFTNNARQNVVAWKFDGPSQAWCARYGTNLLGQSDFPSTLAVGDGFMVYAENSTMIEVPERALEIRYYHQDHLSSSSAITDTTGGLISESANYPFGFARSAFSLGGISEGYQFSQKESDYESGLTYFDARFLRSQLAHFIRVDPLRVQTITDVLGTPQKLNLYAYCANRPVTCVDPTGCEDKSATASTVESKTCTLIVYDDASQGSRSEYTGEANIYTCEGVHLGTVKASTYPDDPSKQNTLATGAHPHDNEDMHHGHKPGLNLRDPNTGKRESPGFDPSGRRITMTEVNEHLGNNASAAEKGRGSRGCPTIPAGADASRFNELTGAATKGKATGITWINRNDACNMPPTREQIRSSLQDNYPNACVENKK